MSWTLIWQTVGVIVFGTLLLRIAGRKSISQMTMAQVVVMIGLGTLIIQPITGNGYWPTFLFAAVLVLVMMLIEYLEMKSNVFETFITGKAVIVIENGELVEQNLSKLRLSVDKLEMRLRQAGIANRSDVQWATLEVSGNLGYQLKTEKQPATKEDLQRLMELLELKVPAIMDRSLASENIFAEIVNGHQNSHPQKLQ